MDVLKIGCGRFIYGSRVILQLPEEIKRYGKKAYLVGGKTTLPMILNITRNTFNEANLDVAVHLVDEFNSVDLAKRLSAEALANNSDVFVAIGGGRCMDVCKVAADMAHLPMISVPTSIATCACCSAVAILYEKDTGRYDCSLPKDHEIESVIMDMDIIASCPRRLTASGIMDSLAKLPETTSGCNELAYPEVSLKKYAAYLNSQWIYRFLMRYGVDVYSNPTGNPERLTDLALINTIVTGMVSGYQSGSGQLAIAHGLYDASKRYFPRETNNSYHGEIVGVGLRMQLFYNGASAAEVNDLERVMRAIHCPMALREIGIAPTDENVDLLARYTIRNNGLSKEEAQRLYRAFELIR